MAELIIGAVGLVALESTVDHFFSRVTTWRAHGEDLENCSLSLAIAGIAYKRWKKSVKLTEGSEDRAATSVQFATEEETSTVVRLLGNIQLAFQNAEKITDKFDDVDLQSSTTFANDLAARANAINHNRQAKANIWQKTRWVFHDKAKLEDLERLVSSNVDKLIKTFPPAAAQLQERLAAIDLQELVPPATASSPTRVLTAERENLARIRDTTGPIDSIMQQVADEAINEVGHRHKYNQPIAEDEAIAFYGDAVNGDVIPDLPGLIFNQPVARGKARVQYGNRINQPDFFGQS